MASRQCLQLLLSPQLPVPPLVPLLPLLLPPALLHSIAMPSCSEAAIRARSEFGSQ
jgi:hypothetical protein